MYYIIMIRHKSQKKGSGSRFWAQTKTQTQRYPDSGFNSIHFGI